MRFGVGFRVEVRVRVRVRVRGRALAPGDHEADAQPAARAPFAQPEGSPSLLLARVRVRARG
eukprot:scaffold93749_cov26-Phaeocystis_antarctica.AAC.1